MSATSLDIIDVLRQRREILGRLVEEPCDKRTLVDDLGVPRSTLDRAVRELEAIDLVSYTDGAYATTPVGKRIVHSFEACLERIDLALSFEPALQYLPCDAFDLDLRALSGAELLVAEPGNPYVMINRQVDRLGEMEQARGLLPLAGLHAHETAHEQIIDEGATAELVVTPAVADTLLSETNFAPLTEELLETGRFDLFVYEGEVPLFVGVFDDETVQIGVDEDGEPRALLETDRSGVREWAHETIDEYKQHATPAVKNELHEPLQP